MREPETVTVTNMDEHVMGKLREGDMNRRTLLGRLAATVGALWGGSKVAKVDSVTPAYDPDKVARFLAEAASRRHVRIRLVEPDGRVMVVREIEVDELARRINDLKRELA